MRKFARIEATQVLDTPYDEEGEIPSEVFAEPEGEALEAGRIRTLAKEEERTGGESCCSGDDCE